MFYLVNALWANLGDVHLQYEYHAASTGVKKAVSTIDDKACHGA